MSLKKTGNDSPEQLNRYLLRIFQRIDKDIYQLVQNRDAHKQLKSLQEIKGIIQFQFKSHQCENLDALKWEFQQQLPEYIKYF